MSKLSKFKSYISPSEAATLLSRLIGEPVSVEDLNIMHTNGWLTANYSCLATIVKLKPKFDQELHEMQVSAGMHLMEEDKDCGMCFGMDLPLGQIVIGQSDRSYALMDAKGEFYALRDHETNQYINDTYDNHPYFEDAKLYPHEIYELAESANLDVAVDPPDVRIRKNYNCLAESDLYNFSPGTDRPVSQPAPAEKLAPPEAPSFVLAVAALVEIATNGETKNRNQSSLIDEILDKYDLRGLSKSNLEKMFSQANRKLAEAKAEKA